MGQGIAPEKYDPVVDNGPPEKLLGMLREMRELFSKGAAAMPTHDDFIRQHCRAPDIAVA